MIAKLFLYRPSSISRYFATSILKRCLSTSVPGISNNYKYLLLLDFEATCEKKKNYLQEIIEFPCLKVNSKTLKEEARFHQYVRPVEKPILSNFCVELTGILQERSRRWIRFALGWDFVKITSTGWNSEMVDEAETFPTVYSQFEEWREKEGLTEENSLYVTSGDWDLGHMMKVQCQLCELNMPSHMLVWADIKKVFAESKTYFYNNFNDILKYYNMTFVGRQHSGIDDCLNMLRAVEKMVMVDGMEFKPTSLLNINTLKVLQTKPVTKYQLSRS